jgi:hypothetical protein
MNELTKIRLIKLINDIEEATINETICTTGLQYKTFFYRNKLVRLIMKDYSGLVCYFRLGAFEISDGEKRASLFGQGMNYSRKNCC